MVILQHFRRCFFIAIFSEVGGSQSFEDLQYHPVQFGDQRVWQGEAMANRPGSAEIHGGLGNKIRKIVGEDGETSDVNVAL